MGVLNVTPDSFSDGGKYFSVESAINQGLKLIGEGADILDIGGESTRPDAVEVSPYEEIKRVIPVIEAIIKSEPGITISIDTTKSEVAEAAINSGAKIINNVFGISHDESLSKLAAKYNTGLILMHIQGTPRNMQKNPIYNNVVEDVFEELRNSIEFARSFGVQKIIADVGIGFGKTLEHNLELLKNHKRFQELGVPLLLGLSRKSFIGKLLTIENTDDRDIPTALFYALLLDSGIDIIRVHNVELINILKKIYIALKD
jgi:dihydropteroate synthase